ncbi:hypothetical protein H2198_009020 [Neophaeococcomyces mojaviensis]|uniref:Uncharacterized protein n=1 Tax=Neophaeococcomyces mojaviensis TaxID=3383035 RepID=A0ACC2ZVK0_9EURO|nr:hypothetical protein H2198_009020 [Knufia sp. JES_112]
MPQMLLSAFTTLLTLHVPTCITAFIASPQQTLKLNKFPTPDIPYTFRPAEFSDISDITDVIVDAFDPGPDWRYTYQFKDKYPAYHRECMRQTIEQQWDFFHDRDGVFMNVIEVPVPSDDNSGDQTLEGDNQKSRVVSIGLFDIKPPFTQTSETQPSSLSTFPFLPFHLAVNNQPPTSTHLHPIVTWPNCTAHLDANVTRAIDFSTKFTAAEHTYIETAYPQGQIYLQVLATHPEYDGHNFGATHCRWGMKLALERGRGEPVTLIATPAGYPLYKSLGYESLRNVTIGMLDGLEVLWYEVMRWGYEGDTWKG